MDEPGADVEDRIGGEQMDNSDFVRTVYENGKPAVFRKSRAKVIKIRIDGFVEVEYDNGTEFVARATKDWPETGRRMRR